MITTGCERDEEYNASWTGDFTMGTTVRQLVRAKKNGAAIPAALRQNAVFIAAAPMTQRSGAGFTVEDLVIAISGGQRLRAQIKHDGRFQVAGGAVAVELVVTRETGSGARQV